MTIGELLKFTKEADASDLHMSTGSPIMVRIYGSMRKLDLPRPSGEELKKMIYDVMSPEHRKKFEEDKEVDFSIKFGNTARFRVNVFTQVDGIAAVFRRIPLKIPSFEELNLPEVLKKLSLKEKGLVLVTGPTGCGKSTTLATMIDYINENKECHIITIEDPVEYYHNSKKSLINQREIRSTTNSFSIALRSALREDPDVILVGEMRDLETISLALTAAETGHLVLATLHTSGAAKSIDRIIDVFSPEQKLQVRSMLAESIEAAISQKLLPTKDGTGRIPALEIMLANVAVRNLIREDKIYQILSVIQANTNMGMQLLDQSLYTLVKAGKVTRDEALQRADNPTMLKKMIDGVIE